MQLIICSNTLQDLGRHSLLLLRSFIPRRLKSGRFVSFGISDCDAGDPLFFFFMNKRLA